MLAQADHNNMGSLSKQHERNKLANSTVNFQRSEKCKFGKNSGEACPRSPLELFGASGTRHTGHFSTFGAISSNQLCIEYRVHRET